MFELRPAPPALTAATLLVLRLSANSPAVRCEGLPGGPARAALAVHREPDGSRTVTLGIRSVVSGAVAYYSLERALADQAGISDAIGAAVSHAAGMGFRFDAEEPMGDATARERAVGIWRGLLDAAADPLELAGAELDLGLGGITGEPAPDLAASGAELDLAIAGTELDPLLGEPPRKSETGPGASGGATAPLTKFRGDNPAFEDTSTRRALGRLKLVKRRRTGAARGRTGDPVLRLLASF